MPLSTLASQSVEVTLNDIAYENYFYARTEDHLVLDFNIDVLEDDVLNDLVVTNQGTARYNLEISNVELWQDDGDNIFEGWEEDILLAQGEFNNSLSWAFRNLNLSLDNSQPTRLFVSADMASNGTVDKTFRFSVPAYWDFDSDGQYDVGDYGVYLESGLEYPAESIAVNNVSKYKKLALDIFKPMIKITNLEEDQLITDDGYTIRGKAKDQGGSSIDKVEVCIDSTCYEAESIEENYSEWRYDWLNLEESEYEVYARTTDTANNVTETMIYNVRTDVAVRIDSEKSSVVVTGENLKANGEDNARIEVTLRNEDNEPIEGKLIKVWQIVNEEENFLFEDTSDVDGELTFNLVTDNPGEKELKIGTAEGEVVEEGLKISFEPAVATADYETGRWIKTADRATVYLLDANNVRHAYPTEKVWNSYFTAGDFSFVETITSEEMATYSLGSNVPFKVGSLFKIPSVPKVYQVTDVGVISWIKTEDKAKELHGDDWASLVSDLPETFYLDYTKGSDLE